MSLDPYTIKVQADEYKVEFNPDDLQATLDRINVVKNSVDYLRALAKEIGLDQGEIDACGDNPKCIVRKIEAFLARILIDAEMEKIKKEAESKTIEDIER